MRCGSVPPLDAAEMVSPAVPSLRLPRRPCSISLEYVSLLCSVMKEVSSSFAAHRPPLAIVCVWCSDARTTDALVLSLAKGCFSWVSIKATTKCLHLVCECHCPTFIHTFGGFGEFFLCQWQIFLNLNLYGCVNKIDLMQISLLCLEVRLPAESFV